jgi:3-hydroxyisobutyrate dehydrogenase/2-hydroxy-3-oxopropionate reductase
VTQLVANLENNLMERGHGDEDVSALYRHFDAIS